MIGCYGNSIAPAFGYPEREHTCSCSSNPNIGPSETGSDSVLFALAALVGGVALALVMKKGKQ